MQTQVPAVGSSWVDDPLNELELPAAVRPGTAAMQRMQQIAGLERTHAASYQASIGLGVKRGCEWRLLEVARSYASGKLGSCRRPVPHSPALRCRRSRDVVRAVGVRASLFTPLSFRGFR